ncbi:MAG: hypothetical protein EBT93_11070 [Alphaproteobacteria bacterium]|nr:hypothetical protein [Alphaproteobacteria bacterium]
MKTTLIKRLIVTIGLICMATIAHAYETMRLDGATLTYETGKIDPQTFNGYASDLTVLFDDGMRLTAKRYLMKTSQSGNEFNVERFEMDGIVIRDDEMMIVIDDINWSSLVFPSNASSFRSLDLDQFDHLKDVGRLMINAISVYENNRLMITIDALLIDGENVDFPILTHTPIQNVTIDLRNAVFRRDIDPSNYDFQQFLDRINRDDLTLNMRMYSNAEPKSDRLNTTVEMVVSMLDAGGVELDIGVGILNSSLIIIDAAMKDQGDDLDDELLGMMLAGGFLNGLRLTIDDDGMLALMLDDYRRGQNMTRYQAVDSIMNEIAFALGSFAPNTFSDIAPEIRRFLDQGGALEIRLAPPSPASFSALIGFAAVPDTAAQALGLSVQHIAP